MIETLTTAAAAFVATNLDDVVIVTVLFARRSATFRGWQIVAGQYLGLALLVAAGFAASRGALALPDWVVAVMGGLVIALGVRELFRDEDDDAGGLRLSTLGVTAITLANGTDNVAVYVPVFARYDLADMVVVGAVFAVLLAAMCTLALYAGSHRVVLRVLDRAGDYAVPVVLIALGGVIVVSSL